MSNICRQFSCYPNKGRESQDFPALRNSCAQKRHAARRIKLIPPQPCCVSPPSLSLSLGGPRALPGTLPCPRDLQATKRRFEWADIEIPSLHTALGVGHVPVSTSTLSMCTPAPTCNTTPQEPHTGCVCSPSHRGCALTSSKIKLSTVLFPMLKLLFKCHYILRADAH